MTDNRQWHKLIWASPRWANSMSCDTRASTCKFAFLICHMRVDNYSMNIPYPRDNHLISPKKYSLQNYFTCEKNNVMIMKYNGNNRYMNQFQNRCSNSNKTVCSDWRIPFTGGDETICDWSIISSQRMINIHVDSETQHMSGIRCHRALKHSFKSDWSTWLKDS